MKYYSTRDIKHSVGIDTAVVNGLAPDGGLYLPEKILPLPKRFFDEISGLSPQDIYFSVAKHLLDGAVPDSDLKLMIDEVFNFDIPVIPIHDNIYTLELFHGPTLAFKDVGARFMSRLLSYFYTKQEKPLNVIVATSGDTGSAVASGFYQVEGINVFILYPKGKVSALQEKQLTTWGGNIQAIEVDGTFDDCQALVKQALADEALKKEYPLTSANSINIARLLPQSMYYFSAYASVQNLQKEVVFSVPSGNFGNLTGGILAQMMGLPIYHFIASTNINDTVPQYLETGTYNPKKSVATISNAMDVGAPSNFERLTDLLNNYQNFKQNITGYSFTDKQTAETISCVWDKHQYLLDPHGSVAYMGLTKYLKDNPGKIGIFLETAHPAKFKNTIDQILDQSIAIPERLAAFDTKEKVALPMSNIYTALVDIIKQ